MEEQIPSAREPPLFLPSGKPDSKFPSRLYTLLIGNMVLLNNFSKFPYTRWRHHGDKSKSRSQIHLKQMQNHHFTLSMEPKNRVWEDDVPFQGVIFRFHVSFYGGVTELGLCIAIPMHPVIFSNSDWGCYITSSA